MCLYLFVSVRELRMIKIKCIIECSILWQNTLFISRFPMICMVLQLLIRFRTRQKAYYESAYHVLLVSTLLLANSEVGGLVCLY